MAGSTWRHGGFLLSKHYESGTCAGRYLKSVKRSTFVFAWRARNAASATLRWCVAAFALHALVSAAFGAPALTPELEQIEAEATGLCPAMAPHQPLSQVIDEL